MKRGELASVLVVFNELYDLQLTELNTEIWFNALAMYDIEDVKSAAMKYIRTGKYKPKPADIIDIIVDDIVAKAEPKEELSAQEAWSLVYKAICNSAYKSIEEFNKLPELVQKAVGSADNLKSNAIDAHFNLGVTQSNFYKAYTTLLKRQENDRLLKIEQIKRGELPVSALLLERGNNEQLIDKGGTS